MHAYLTLGLALAFAAGHAIAGPADRIGGADVNTQTIHHCGYLPTQNVIYTNTEIPTRIIQEKLSALHYYHGAIDGKAGKLTREAVRAFQSEYGLAVDGAVGINTAQRLSYFTHASPNARRCWHLAQPIY